jgi:hypothetical protein
MWLGLGLGVYPLFVFAEVMVPPLRRVTFSNSRKSNQKGRAPGWARLRRVPSLRSRSVGTRRTGIHALTALSPHPCGSAHCARPAFSLHPSRDWRCLGFLRMKIKSVEADQGLPGWSRSHRVNAVLSVGPASAGKRPAQAPAILLIAPPSCGSELARESCISNTNYSADVPMPSRASSLPQVPSILSPNPPLICF